MTTPTLKELEAKFGDEMRGLLIEAFGYNEYCNAAGSPDMKSAAKGSFIINQFSRSRDLLTRIHAFMQPKEEPPPKPAAPANNQHRR